MYTCLASKVYLTSFGLLLFLQVLVISPLNDEILFSLKSSIDHWWNQKKQSLGNQI